MEKEKKSLIKNFKALVNLNKMKSCWQENFWGLKKVKFQHIFLL